MRKITTLRAFKAYLNDYGIDFSTWGEGPTKPVERLFYEYQSGETAFIVRRKRLVRVVKTVRILVYYTSRRGNRYYLVETRQVFANGSARTRSRNRTNSEKMMPEEKARPAALRALKEELGITGVDPNTLQKLKYRREKLAISDSYPGLRSIHHGPRFKWVMPRAWYERAGYDEVQSDKTTEFRWQKVRKRKSRKRK